MHIDTNTTNSAILAAMVSATAQNALGLCGCGCGNAPAGKKSRFMPGHDAKFYASLNPTLSPKVTKTGDHTVDTALGLVRKMSSEQREALLKAMGVEVATPEVTEPEATEEVEEVETEEVEPVIEEAIQ